MPSGGSGIDVEDDGEGSGDGESSTRGGEADIESRISIVAM